MVETLISQRISPKKKKSTYRLEGLLDKKKYRSNANVVSLIHVIVSMSLKIPCNTLWYCMRFFFLWLEKEKEQHFRRDYSHFHQSLSCKMLGLNLVLHHRFVIFNLEHACV